LELDASSIISAPADFFIIVKIHRKVRNIIQRKQEASKSNIPGYARGKVRYKILLKPESLFRPSGASNSNIPGYIRDKEGIKVFIKPEVLKSNIPGYIRGKKGIKVFIKPEVLKSNIPGYIRGKS